MPPSTLASSVLPPKITPKPPSTFNQMTLSVIVVVILALYFARAVLMPLTLAVLLSILLAPLVGILRRLRLGRIVSVLLAVMLSISVVLGVGGIIGMQVAQLATEAPTYARTIQDKAEAVRGLAVDGVKHVVDSLGYVGAAPKGTAKGAKPPPRSVTPPAPSSNTQDGPKPMPVEVHQPDPTPVELVELYLSPLLSPIGTVGIVFVVAIFILLQQEDLRDRLIRLFGSGDLRRTTVALDDGGRRLSRYFATQLAINSGFGVIIAIGLYFIGVPNPVLWGALCLLLRFVPYIGSMISALFPMALAAAVDPGWSMILWTGGLFVVVEGTLSQLIEPLVYGHSTGLSPVSVVVAAIFWSWLWGPVGLVLSTPLTLCLVVLGRHVERLSFLDILLGDRPALTPVESFYQRMLAADQDEARDHAEQLLTQRSLTSFYDDVALPGLELAAVDAQRGILTPDQIRRFKETITELVEELSEHADRQPAAKPLDNGLIGGLGDTKEPSLSLPPDSVDGGVGGVDGRVGGVDGQAGGIAAIWGRPAPVLCIAGRGPLDEAASSMLSQLLTKHGIGARIAPYEAAMRGNINLLDVEGVAMVCVSYLDVTGKQAHLRYLLQRLRQRMPNIPILVGLWPEDDPADRRVQAGIGADYLTRSLREAVQTCVGIARSSAETAFVPTVAVSAVPDHTASIASFR
ncbi:MAG TPA: AI-2E family transporter [Stellaceae bacterium]|nr:AI-2E family transporter [Stellaceae bacterium]